MIAEKGVARFLTGTTQILTQFVQQLGSQIQWLVAARFRGLWHWQYTVLGALTEHSTSA